MEKKIFNSFFTEIFVFKASNKNFGEKLLNILFSIKIENNTSNSFFKGIFCFPLRL